MNPTHVNPSREFFSKRVVEISDELAAMTAIDDRD
jgi:hypothetical protein